MATIDWPKAAARAGAAASAKPSLFRLRVGSGRAELAGQAELASFTSRLGVNEIPSAQVVLSVPDGPLAEFKNHALVAAQCRIGTVVEIERGTTVLFTGIVVSQEMSSDRGGARLSLQLRHVLQRLLASHRSQVFERMSDAKIVRGLLTAHHIAAGQVSGLDTVHPQMVQLGSSDWQFLQARLRAANVWLVPTPKGVDIGPPRLAGQARHVVSAAGARPGGGPRLPGHGAAGQAVECLAASWKFSGHAQPAALNVASWDAGRQSMARASHAQAAVLGRGGLDPARLPALTSMPWAVAHSVPLAHGEQAALANGRLSARHATGIRASFTVDGAQPGVDYALGDTLRVVGAGDYFSGDGIITAIAHAAQRGSFRTTVSLGLDGSPEIDSPLLPPADGLYIGIVDEHQDDPSGLNRLRVKVPALQLDNRSLWARFSMPYASKGSGVCFYPERGDEVVLGFFESDPRHPVILGAMHNPKNTAPYAPSKDNPQKGVVLVKGGHKQHLVFDAKAKSAALDSGQQALLLHDGVRLSSADGPVEITAKQDLKLSGKQTALRSEGNFSVSAAQIGVSATQQLDLSGKAGVRVKGAKVDLGH